MPIGLSVYSTGKKKKKQKSPQNKVYPRRNLFPRSFVICTTFSLLFIAEEYYLANAS